MPDVLPAAQLPVFLMHVVLLILLITESGTLEAVLHLAALHSAQNVNLSAAPFHLSHLGPQWDPSHMGGAPFRPLFGGPQDFPHHQLHQVGELDMGPWTFYSEMTSCQGHCQDAGTLHF